MIEQQLGGNVALDNVEHAKQALARSDLAQALFHISSALATDPANKEWRAFLDGVLARTPDPMVFVRPDEAKADFITAATRAYVLAFKQQWADAFVTLAEVVDVRPDCGFMVWAAEWVGRPGAVAALTPEVLEKRFLPRTMSWLSSLGPNVPKEAPERVNVDATVTVLGAIYNAHPQLALLVLACSSVLRRAGQFDQAIQYAAYAFQLQADWGMCIGLACAYRDAGKVDDAVATFRRAHQMRPDDAAALLDIGDTYLEAKRYDEAIGAYREVLAKQADDPWATASIAYAELMKSQAPADREKLYALTERNGRARELFYRLVGNKPYFTWLPQAGDSMAFAARDIMRQMTQRPPPPTGVGVDVLLKHMEAPSALFAFQLWARAKGWNNVGLAAKVEGVQTPDTRFPKGQVEFALWAYDGNTPRPAVSPPDPRVSAAISEIAKRPYCLEMWEPAARALAQQMGPAWANQLLFAMVHPPPLPNLNYEPIDWMRRCQIATALVLGFIDQGWEGSQRRRALTTVAMGPTDWITDAALIVMGYLATREPALRADVEKFFGWMESQIPKNGYTCFEYPLVNTWIHLGNHDDATQKRLALWKKRCESQKVEFAEERQGGLTLEQYAELAALRDDILMGHAGTGGGGAMMAMAAMAGGGPQPELAALCKQFNIPAPMSAAAARIPGWDQKLNADPNLMKRFIGLQQNARLKRQGIDPNSHEGRVAAQIRSGGFDVESQKQNASAAAAQIASGQGGDADPVVFPGQKLAKLSDYVGLMKAMQTGDMNGALRKYGLDMGSYMQASQAWGIKLAADPMLTQKFGKMMAGG